METLWKTERALWGFLLGFGGEGGGYGKGRYGMWVGGLISLVWNRSGNPNGLFDFCLGFGFGEERRGEGGGWVVLCG